MPEAVERYQVELSARRLRSIRKLEPRPDPLDVSREGLMAVHVEGSTSSQGGVSWFKSCQVVTIATDGPSTRSEQME